MSKIWELIDSCEDEPFSSINFSMFRISINSAYEGLGENINISTPSIEESYDVKRSAHDTGTYDIW